MIKGSISVLVVLALTNYCIILKIFQKKMFKLKLSHFFPEGGSTCQRASYNKHIEYRSITNQYTIINIIIDYCIKRVVQSITHSIINYINY